MPVTFWAPGIVRAGDTFHMFVTYRDNANPPWGSSGNIAHCRTDANDLLSGREKVNVQARAELHIHQQKLSFLQVAELELEDGQLTSDRDKAIQLPAAR